MPTDADFLRAIIADPDNDVPRLIYADWLEEHGETARADFVRVQCELAKPRPACEWLDLNGGPCPDYNAKRPPCRVINWCPTCGRHEARMAHPRRRECDLLETHHRGWAPPGWDWGLLHDLSLGAPLDPYVTASCIFHRGFVDALACSCADWLRHGHALTQAAPIRDVTLGGCMDPTTWSGLDLVGVHRQFRPLVDDPFPFVLLGYHRPTKGLRSLVLTDIHAEILGAVTHDAIRAVFPGVHVSFGTGRD